MVKIFLTKVLENYTTNDDGDILFETIKKYFDNGKSVDISFEGVHGLNTSFVNSAFIQLLEIYSFDFIKKNLHFSESNKQINNLILSRFKFETQTCQV